jgi:hypothetical protein
VTAEGLVALGEQLPATFLQPSLAVEKRVPGAIIAASPGPGIPAPVLTTSTKKMMYSASSMVTSWRSWRASWRSSPTSG